jgi:hypothetical protein
VLDDDRTYYGRNRFVIGGGRIRVGSGSKQVGPRPPQWGASGVGGVSVGCKMSTLWLECAHFAPFSGVLGGVGEVSVRSVGLAVTFVPLERVHSVVPQGPSALTRWGRRFWSALRKKLIESAFWGSVGCSVGSVGCSVGFGGFVSYSRYRSYVRGAARRRAHG